MRALSVETDSKESLENTARTVAVTVDLSRIVAIKVDQQTRQMQGFLVDLDNISSTMDRSLIILRRIGLKVLTDKYVCAITWIVIALVVVVIILRYVM